MQSPFIHPRKCFELLTLYLELGRRYRRSHFTCEAEMKDRDSMCSFKLRYLEKWLMPNLKPWQA